MGDLSSAFPYLSFAPEKRASMFRWSETHEDFDGELFDVWHENFSVVDASTNEDMDEDEFDGECLLDIGNGAFSYGRMGGGELVEHRLGLGLNDIGARWAVTLKVLVEAEIISVDVEPHMISVAPWHGRFL